MAKTKPGAAKRGGGSDTDKADLKLYGHLKTSRNTYYLKLSPTSRSDQADPRALAAFLARNTFCNAAEAGKVARCLERGMEQVVQVPGPGAGKLGAVLRGGLRHFFRGHVLDGRRQEYQ